jgi:hypothetical protein
MRESDLKQHRVVIDRDGEREPFGQRLSTDPDGPICKRFASSPAALPKAAHRETVFGVCLN